MVANKQQSESTQISILNALHQRAVGNLYFVVRSGVTDPLISVGGGRPGRLSRGLVGVTAQARYFGAVRADNGLRNACQVINRQQYDLLPPKGIDWRGRRKVTGKSIQPIFLDWSILAVVHFAQELTRVQIVKAFSEVTEGWHCPIFDYERLA